MPRVFGCCVAIGCRIAFQKKTNSEICSSCRYHTYGADGFNKTGTSKVGAVSKAQKAQSFQNSKRGGPFGRFQTSVCFAAKYRKT